VGERVGVRRFVVLGGDLLPVGVVADVRDLHGAEVGQEVLLASVAVQLIEELGEALRGVLHELAAQALLAQVDAGHEGEQRQIVAAHLTPARDRLPSDVQSALE